MPVFLLALIVVHVFFKFPPLDFKRIFSMPARCVGAPRIRVEETQDPRYPYDDGNKEHYAANGPVLMEILLYYVSARKEPASSEAVS